MLGPAPPPLAGPALQIVQTLLQEFGPAELDTLVAWASGRIPPHPPRCDEFGTVHPIFHYQAEAGHFNASAEGPVCRRGGRIVTEAEQADVRFQRAVWNWDEAHVIVDTGIFEPGYYPEFDYEAAYAVNPGLCRCGCDPTIFDCFLNVCIL